MDIDIKCYIPNRYEYDVEVNKMKVTKVRHDKDKGTDYFSIDEISNWDLERLYRLLEAEKARARIVEGFDRGSKDLLMALQPLAKERLWKIR